MRHVHAALLSLVLWPALLIGQQTETRTCELETVVTAKLECDECIPFPPEPDGSIRFEYEIRTNTVVVVTSDNTPAVRFERDLRSRALTTIDTLPTILELEFIERPKCPDGAPMEVEKLGENTFCVAPHRGAFAVVGRLSFGAPTLCDDAGCYVATVTITVSALPLVESR